LDVGMIVAGAARFRQAPDRGTAPERGNPPLARPRRAHRPPRIPPS